MSLTVRRLLGVVLAVSSLVAGTAFFSSQRATQLDAARARAQAEVDAELPKVAATLNGLSLELAKTAERAVSLGPFTALLGVTTNQSDFRDTANTVAGYEIEPFFEPYTKVGPHSVFLGTMPVYSSEAAFLPLFEGLVASATTTGKATGLVSFQGAVWLLGAARSSATNPQQHHFVFAFAQKLTSERLDAVAAHHAAALLIQFGATPTDVIGGGKKDFVEVLRRHLTLMKREPEPCCAQKEIAPGVKLVVHQDTAPRLKEAAADATATAPPIFGVTGLFAVGALAFAFWPQRKMSDENTELLKQTAAQLKDSQEELKRLSLRIETSTDRVAMGLDKPASDEDGLGSTQARVQASRYEVVAPLGEGGMARVAVAVVRGAEGFRRTFVVKRLRPELAGNAEVVSQFIDEARLGASLVHSNIIPVFDFGRDAEGYYLAQEYILGRDVDALITASKDKRSQPLEPGLVSYIAQEGLKALGYAHTRVNDAGVAMGLVHRDVSPNNLMVSARGEVKLLDFGIVKSDDRATRTQAGVVKGNLFFMSPEQARALPVDPRSDLFSMGMVLVSALTGETLYSGENVYDLMTRAAVGPTDADRERVRRECGVLADVVLKALSVDPAQRFPNAEAFGQALAATGLTASAGELQGLVDALFAAEFAAERQKFAVPA
jgi:hypothetical protein